MPSSPASCCSVYLEPIVETNAGRLRFGFATGFLYAGPNATRWLVTNWHVVTGRRPDDPGILTVGKPASPSWLKFKVEDPAGSPSQEVELALYEAGKPTWIEGGRERGVDLVLIRVNDKPRFSFPLSQTFAPTAKMPLAPGLDVVIVGHPFELGKHSPAAIWKGAMVASDQDHSSTDRPWTLLDAPGVPGMSGSPVYRRHPRMDPKEKGGFGATRGLDRDPTDREGNINGVNLQLLGVYAGAVGDKALEELRLGRVFPISLVEEILRGHEPGRNPFPPTL